MQQLSKTAILCGVLWSAFVPAAGAQQLNRIPPAYRPVSSRVSYDLVGNQQLEAAKRGWKRSLIPVLASQALDSASSYGRWELNPLLADPSGRFGARAVTVKLGATAAIIGIEYWIIKKHPGAARVISKLNWSGAVITSGFAVHNFAIR
jgi:hypothetical protein